MRRRAYGAVRVKDVDWQELIQGQEGVDVHVSADVGKFELWLVCRWADGRFERPWRVDNPTEIPRLVALLTQFMHLLIDNVHSRS